ncbi:response regulator transcription factor [Metabacillus arenae]|uniref:Response regulator n=1 Tax=Metabacillus arenae TaxID=2771434 RepID=A0A926N7Q8_9BACI|nr:response regulator [Metabacillus arenae]MBD1378907.1 response regulator [Metabacillus arenae]
MRVIIVDDEQHVRTSIKSLVDWEKHGISEIDEAENGMEAIEIINKRKPSIIITDMVMPYKNGVQLLEWVEDHCQDSRIIVISGYNDFELVRSTIKHGVIDYLLKPIDQQQLIDTIEQAIIKYNKSLDERNELVEKNRKVVKLSSIYKDKLLSQHLTQEHNQYDQLLKELGHEYPLLHNIKHTSLAIIDVALLNKQIRHDYNWNNELLTFSVRNICNEILNNGKKGIVFQNLNSPNEIAIILWNDKYRGEAILQEINQVLEKLLYTKLYIGFSPGTPYMTRLAESYEKAKIALLNNNLLDKDNFINSYTQNEIKRYQSLNFAAYSDDLKYALKSSNPNRIKCLLDKWYDYLKQLYPITLGQLKMWLHEFSVIKMRWLQELSVKNDLVYETTLNEIELYEMLDRNGNLDLSLLIQTVAKDLKELSVYYCEQIVQSTNVIHQIARYIEINYEKNLSLQELSDEFLLNKEHISRKFKQIFNETFINYLNRIRIEKAKLLLENPNIKIIDIAFMVGYQDEKYFSRVFKKIEGKSPKDYRALHTISNML